MDIITIDFSFEIFNYSHLFNAFHQLNARYKPDPTFLLLLLLLLLISSISFSVLAKI